VFAAVTLAPVLLAIAWLLPGAGLLLAGRLLPSPMLVIFIPLTIALFYFAMRQLPVSWPKFASGRPAALAAEAPAPAAAPVAAPRATGPAPAVAPAPALGPRGRRARPDAPAWAVLTTVAIALGFAAWQALERSQQLIVFRDPGEYFQYAWWIAEHGTARIPTYPGAFGSIPGLQFTSPGFLANGSGLTPAFMAGLPLAIAAGLWAHGVGGGLLVAPFLGGCAILSFAGLAGRLAGGRWAPAAALVLAVTLPEQYASRTSLSDPLVQVLLFGGLSLVLDSLVVNTPGFRPPGLRPAPKARGRRVAWQAMTLAWFGGIALGLTVLANIGSLAILLPLFPFLALIFIARRPQAGPLTVGLVIGAGLSVLEGVTLARPYLATLAPQLHDIGFAAAAFGVLTALIAPFAFPAVRARARRVTRWRMPVMGLGGQTRRIPVVRALAEGVALLIPVAALIGLAIRPSVQVTKGATDPYVIDFVAAVQRVAGLPVDGRQQYYEQSLNWVIWYVGLPAVLLAVIGAALLGRRCVRALFQWRGTPVAARFWALPLMVFFWATAVTLWDPATLPDQPWASRRLVPVVLPALICLALWVCSRIRMRGSELGAGPLTGGLVVACSVLALAIPAAVTTFDPGYVSATTSSGSSASATTSSSVTSATGPAASTSGTTGARHLAVRGMALRTTYTREYPAVFRICKSIDQSTSVLIVDASTTDALAQTVRGMCGVPVARLTDTSSSAVQQAVTAVQHAGRQPVLLGSTSASVAVTGAQPRQLVNLKTAQDAHLLTGPPAAPWELDYTVWLATPAAS
jgi:hypothetical protein